MSAELGAEKKPQCFQKGFSKKSEFCMKVCRHVVECSGEAIIEDEGAQIKNQYHRGMMSFKEMIAKRMEVIKSYKKKNYEARNSEMPNLWAVSEQEKSEPVKNTDPAPRADLPVVRREQETRVYPEGYQASPFG